MTQQEIDQLFNANVLEIDKLNTASGSMIIALIQGIESNGPAYIRLSGAVNEGHRVNYEHISGDASLVSRVGGSLGLIITDNSIETRHA